MLFRVIVLLGCIIVFINGCNSLISQHFGTHKLRTFSMDEVIGNGIGDADFVEIHGAWQTGDFVYVPPRRGEKKGIILYPLLADRELTEADAGRKVAPRLIVWTEDFDPACVEQKNCIERKEVTLKGIIRELSREKNLSSELPKQKYDLSARIVYIEAGRAPLPWHWNLGMMAGAFLIAFYMEWSRGRGQ
jgi:hypothetical protein